VTRARLMLIGGEKKTARRMICVESFRRELRALLGRGDSFAGASMRFPRVQGTMSFIPLPEA